MTNSKKGCSFGVSRLAVFIGTGRVLATVLCGAGFVSMSRGARDIEVATLRADK